MDFALIQQLHATANDESAKSTDRDDAQNYLLEHEAEIVAAYLALPENLHTDKGRAGQPRFTIDDLERLGFWLQHREDEREPLPEFFARAEKLKSDRIGLVLRHREWIRARESRVNDWDVVTIFGDEFALALWPVNTPPAVRSAASRKRLGLE